MTDKEKTRDEPLAELQQTLQAISELEMREIELTQSLGQEYAGSPRSRPVLFYFSRERAFICQPGVSFFPFGRDALSSPDGLFDESDPDFSFFRGFVYSEDFPALESDLKELWTGHKDTISRRLRMHVRGEPFTWVEVHFVPIKRDDHQNVTEGTVWWRPLGQPIGTGPHLNQIRISVEDLFESLEEEDSPLLALFASRWKDRAITKQEALDDVSSLAFVVTTAESWSLQGPWDLSFVKDHAMKYVWASKPFAGRLGRSVRELQGRSDSDLYATVDEAEEIRIGQAVIDGAEAHLQRTRIASGTPEVFQDTLWRYSPGRKSGTGWIVGVSRLVEPGVVTVAEPYGSPAMLKAMKIALRAAQFDSKVVLTGETGSGKGDLAEIIHKHSRRSTGPIIIKNCAAIPKDLFESELFGHEKGAFTGAIRQKKGLLELAHGGTLLLDEIGKMPLDVQGKLLVFLDEKGFFRVGGLKTLTSDVRILVASNIDLEKLVADGLFLKDLYYRLNVIPIKVPPLRERFDELPSLIPKLRDQVCEDLGLAETPPIPTSVFKEAKEHDWEGNIRELKNIIERSLVLSGGKSIDIRSALSDSAQEPDDASQIAFNDDWRTMAHFPQDGQSLDDVLEMVQRDLVEEALRRVNGNITEAARCLKISPNRVRRKRKKTDETGTP